MNHGVLFHIDEPEKWGLLLRNVSNLREAAPPREIRIEVVANAQAVSFYAGRGEDADRARMRELARAGVRFTACGNALRGLNIPKEQLPAFVEVVPAGVLELVEKQAQGYAYIKP